MTFRGFFPAGNKVRIQSEGAHSGPRRGSRSGPVHGRSMGSPGQRLKFMSLLTWNWSFSRENPPIPNPVSPWGELWWWLGRWRAVMNKTSDNSKHAIRTGVPMTFQDFFRQATRSESEPKGCTPYPYQERFADADLLPHLVLRPDWSGKDSNSNPRLAMAVLP